MKLLSGIDELDVGGAVVLAGLGGGGGGKSYLLSERPISTAKSILGLGGITGAVRGTSVDAV